MCGTPLDVPRMTGLEFKLLHGVLCFSPSLVSTCTVSRLHALRCRTDMCSMLSTSGDPCLCHNIIGNASVTVLVPSLRADITCAVCVAHVQSGLPMWHCPQCKHQTGSQPLGCRRLIPRHHLICCKPCELFVVKPDSPTSVGKSNVELIGKSCAWKWVTCRKGC